MCCRVHLLARRSCSCFSLLDCLVRRVPGRVLGGSSGLRSPVLGSLQVLLDAACSLLRGLPRRACSTLSLRAGGEKLMVVPARCAKTLTLHVRAL